MCLVTDYWKKIVSTEYLIDLFEADMGQRVSYQSASLVVVKPNESLDIRSPLLPIGEISGLVIAILYIVTAASPLPVTAISRFISI